MQPEEVYELIQLTGVYRCNGAKSVLIEALETDAPYQWMASQMIKHIGHPPDGVVFPVWAWHTMYWEHKRPDMRRTEFRSYERPFVLLEIEVQDRDVLLSDEEGWYYVLNDWYFSDSRNEIEHKENCEMFDSLSQAEQKIVKEKSWERILAVSPPFENEWERVGCFIQATFWELRKEYIVKVWHYK